MKQNIGGIQNMHSINKLINKFKDNTYFNLMLLGITPTFIVLICVIIISAFSLSSTKHQAQANAESTMKILSSSNLENMNNIIEVASIFIQNENLSNYLYSPNIPLSSELISTPTQVISNYTNIFESVDNIFLLNQNSDTIIYTGGASSIHDYLNFQYSYLNYSEDYWKKNLFWDDSKHRILSPTTANSASGTKSILPIIIRDINNNRLNTYIVINIDLDKFLTSTPVTPTVSSKLYVLNCYSHKVFPIHESESEYSEISAELYSELLKGTNRTFNFKINNKKYFIVSHSNVIGLNGFIYYYAIPFNDLLSSQQLLYIITTLVILLFTLVAMLILHKRTNKIYSPIKSLAEQLSIDTKNINFADINSSVESLNNQNISLRSALPHAQEKYLINFLNSAEYAFNKETQNLILQNLPFKNSLFVYIIIQTSPTQQMLQEFSSEGYNNIQQGLYDLIKNTYSSKFNAFFLSTNQNSIHIILNLEKTIQKDEISSAWKQITELLKNDREYIKLYYGESDIHEDMIGLKLAHEQALRNLASVASENEPNTQPSTPKSLITRADESKLYNYLVANETDAAKNLINSYKDRFTFSDIQIAKNFYSKVLSVILKVLQTKKISYSESAKNDYEFINDILQNDTNNAHNVVIELLEKIKIHSTKKDTKNIIPYISENFSNKNLSLEYIASLFETSSSYVSTFIKNNLNVGFHEYLTSLRVAEAKSLLTETKTPISDICNAVGFSSRTTFFRSFKQDTGMTPSEFRNHNSRS